MNYYFKNIILLWNLTYILISFFLFINLICAILGAVSVAGALPGLWAVAGGNQQIPEGLFKYSGAHMYKRRVTAITLAKNNSYTVASINAFGERIESPYDIVIVASPLHDNVTNIQFENFSKEVPIFPQSFHTTVATFVRGVPNYKKFGYGSLHEFPETFLATDPLLPWNSIGRQVPVDFGVEFNERLESSPVWKIFSQRTLTTDEISELFLEYELLDSIEWKAYPDYSSNEIDVPPFELHDNLYYTNAIELCASAMEMSAVAARNVALLAHNKWYNVLNKVDGNVTHILELHKIMSKEEL